MAALLAIVVALLLYGTLAPFRFDFAHHPGNPFLHLLHSWPARIDRNFYRDAVLNVTIFAPLGATAWLTFARHFSRRTSFALALLHGCTLSACIEMLQYYDGRRYSSAADWLFNTVGTLAGAVLALALERRIRALVAPAGQGGAAPCILLAACWMGSQLYPLLPRLTFAQLRGGWAVLAVSRISWVEVMAGAAGWFVFAFALSCVWKGFRWPWLALAMCAVPLRLVIAGRVATVSDLAAALLGLLLWCVVADRARQGVAWLLLAAAILLRELAPFDFGGPAHPFAWLPFYATIGAERAPGVAVILRKAFEYGAMIWLLRAGKVRNFVATGSLAAALLAMEIIQTRMPGRQPEITDAVLALIMGLVLWLIR